MKQLPPPSAEDWDNIVVQTLLLSIAQLQHIPVYELAYRLVDGETFRDRLVDAFIDFARVLDKVDRERGQKTLFEQLIERGRP